MQGFFDKNGKEIKEGMLLNGGVCKFMGLSKVPNR